MNKKTPAPETETPDPTKPSGDEKPQAAQQPPVKPEASTPTSGANDGKDGFDQEKVNKLVGDARKEGRDKAREALLKELGVEDFDKAKAALEEAKNLKKAQMTEAERIAAEKSDLEKRLADSESAKQRAEEERKSALLQAEIVSKAAGIFANPKAIVKLIDLSGVKFEDGQFTGIDEVLTKLAEAEPWTLAPKAGALGTKLGATNPDSKPKARTDTDRKADYFGGASSTFFEGGGVEIRSKQ